MVSLKVLKIDVREISEIIHIFLNLAAFLSFFLRFSGKFTKNRKMSRCDSEKRVQLRNQGEPDFNVQVFGVIAQKVYYYLKP